MSKDTREKLTAKLHSAIYDKVDLEEIEQLIARNADVNGESLSGSKPLHLAVIFNYLEAAELLIKNGADIQGLFKGSSPLGLALASYNTEIAKLLIEAKADVTPEIYKAFSPLFIATFNNNLSTARDKSSYSSLLSPVLDDSSDLSIANNIDYSKDSL